MSRGTASPRSRSACMAPTAVILLTVKIAVGSGRKSEHLLGGAITPDTIHGGSKHQLVVIGETGIGQGKAISFETLAAGRDVIGLGDMGDAAMTERDQMCGELAGAGNVVAYHHVAVGVGQRTVKQDDREAALEQGPKSDARSIAGGCNQKAVDPVAHKVVNIFAFQAQIALAVAQQHPIAGLARSRFRAADHWSEEWVDHVRHDEADCPGVAAKPGRGPVDSAHSRAPELKSSTRRWVSGSTPALPFTTRETVMADTPARLATSRNVTAIAILLPN